MQRLSHVSLPLRGGERDDGLRILQLTDLHLFPSTMVEWANGSHKAVPLDVPRAGGRAPYSTSACLKLCGELSVAVRPHLVVLTGDVVDGRPFGELALGPDAWRECFETLVMPLVAAGIPWTFVPGNHDDDCSPWSRDDLLAVYALEGCASRGATSFNHTFTVSVGDDGASTRLFFFDSGGNDAEHAYGTIDASAVAEFAAFNDVDAEAEKAAQVAAPSAANGLAFFHIPLPEAAALDPVVGHNGLFDAALAGGKVPKPWCWLPFVVRFLGKDRIVGCSKLNSGLFDEFVRTRAVRACFFGHDHHSDAVFQREGLYMAYGRYSSCLPPSDWEGKSPLPFAPGGRVIEVRAPREGEGEARIATWVVTTAGEAPRSRVVLNARRRTGTSTTAPVSGAALLAAAAAAAVAAAAAFFVWQHRRAAKETGADDSGRT
jgi:hypothetical protein